MATRGRKPVGDRPATAAERKAQFDKRMRNAAGETPGAPVRSPAVIYLSAEARAVLSKNRQARNQARQPQLLDSQIVESLLLAYERLLPCSQTNSQADIEHALARIGGPVLEEFDRLTRAVRALELQLITLRDTPRT